MSFSQHPLAEIKAHLDALLVRAAQESEDRTTEDEDALREAVATFLASGPDILEQATPHLWSYYHESTEGLTSQERTLLGVPDLDEDIDIWTQVSFHHPPAISPGDDELTPGRSYLSFEGEVSWEPEHGLQLVFLEGEEICKVGPYDGHLTNAHAYDDPSLLDVVFRR